MTDISENFYNSESDTSSSMQNEQFTDEDFSETSSEDFSDIELNHPTILYQYNSFVSRFIENVNVSIKHVSFER